MITLMCVCVSAHAHICVCVCVYKKPLTKGAYQTSNNITRVKCYI